MLTVSQFIKKYPGADTAVLQIDNWEIGKGIYWIKGENGAGKTSLIKCIAGLLNFSGEIAVNNFKIKKHRQQYTRQVNYAEAEPLFPPFLTGVELLEFYSNTNGGPIPNTLIEEMNMEHFLQQKTGTYSSGMMKKLSLALAFTGKPSLILLDEPLIALDTKAVIVLQNYIAQQLKKEVSFLVTSHQPLDASIVAYTGTYLVANKTLTLQ
jgi:ABC-2 type transport system ATP-binding protein